MLINQPEIKYDYSNFHNEELSFFSRGFQLSRDIFSDLKNIPKRIDSSANFLFFRTIITWPHY